MIETSPFDAADYLETEEDMVEYLNAILEENDPDLLLLALKDIARAKGMTQLAKDSGLGRESLYKALTPGSQPRYSTIVKVLGALGVSLHAQPKNAPTH